MCAQLSEGRFTQHVCFSFTHLCNLVLKQQKVLNARFIFTLFLKIHKTLLIKILLLLSSGIPFQVTIMLSSVNSHKIESLGLRNT